MKLKDYLKFSLPFALGGALIGAWLGRKYDAPEDWWVMVGVGAVLGGCLGDLVRLILRKGPITLK